MSFEEPDNLEVALPMLAENEPTVLSPEEYAAIDAALASFERGEGMTVEEAFQLARHRTRTWMKPSRKIQAA